MSRHRKEPLPPSRARISHYFTPTSHSTTTNTLKPPSAPSQETTSSTSQHSLTAKTVKLDSMFKLVGVQKAHGSKQPLRKLLSTKVKCDAKVAPNADDNYPKKDVNLTADDELSEARKIQRRGGHINLKLSYPWEWWQCWFESRDNRYSYYEARRNHGVICSCCENARWRQGFRVVKNLCEDCTRDTKCRQHPCDHLVKKITSRRDYKKTLPRRINVITTKEVIALKLQLEGT